MRPHFLSLTHLCYSCSFYTLIYQNHRNKTDGPNKDLEPLLYLHDIKPHYQALYCNMYIRRYFLVSHIQRMIRTSISHRSVLIRSLQIALKNYSCRASCSCRSCSYTHTDKFRQNSPFPKRRQSSRFPRMRSAAQDFHRRQNT